MPPRGRADAVVVAAMRQAIGEAAEDTTQTAAFVFRQTREILARDGSEPGRLQWLTGGIRQEMHNPYLSGPQMLRSMTRRNQLSRRNRRRRISGIPRYAMLCIPLLARYQVMEIAMADTTVIAPEPNSPQPPAAQETRGPSAVMIAALVVSVVAVVLGAVGLTFGIIERSHVDHQARLIATLQHHQVLLQREMVAILPKVSGAARDVITCGDLQNMYLQSYYIDSNYNLQSTQVPLPQHCINR